jgi:hypothetical protein
MIPTVTTLKPTGANQWTGRFAWLESLGGIDGRNLAGRVAGNRANFRDC